MEHLLGSAGLPQTPRQTTFAWSVLMDLWSFHGFDHFGKFCLLDGLENLKLIQIFRGVFKTILQVEKIQKQA